MGAIHYGLQSKLLDFIRVSHDSYQAVRIAAVSSATKLLQAWFYVPFGILVILAFCRGIDALLTTIGVSFPASVACLIMLLFSLLLSEAILGGHRTSYVVALINVPGSWALRWINVFFTPAFIGLPLSKSIGLSEVAKIVAIFVVGFVVTMALSAFSTRGLQLLLGSREKVTRESASDIAIGLHENPSIVEMNESTPNLESTPTSLSPNSLHPLETHPRLDELPQVFHPNRAQPLNMEISMIQTHRSLGFPLQNAPSPTRAQVWATNICAHLDLTIYTIVFCIGIPLYYTIGFSMPAHLSCCVLSYLASMYIPPKHRTYLHPTLVSSLLTVLVIWILAAIRGDSLSTALQQFKTEISYQALWSSELHAGEFPGAGDMLAAAMDASIVSLALPMHQHRRELREHLLVILVPALIFSVGSLLAYPAICFAIGISTTRSLALASRSLTLALAMPATTNLGGDVNTVAASAVMSGILGALVGQRMLTWFRIPQDDYITRGVTLGINSAAIATALLLQTDPRAAALSSLSMSMFGTITVLLTSIPPIVGVVKSFVI